MSLIDAPTLSQPHAPEGVQAMRYPKSPEMRRHGIQQLEEQLAATAVNNVVLSGRDIENAALTPNERAAWNLLEEEALSPRYFDREKGEVEIPAETTYTDEALAIAGKQAELRNQIEAMTPKQQIQFLSVYTAYIANEVRARMLVESRS